MAATPKTIEAELILRYKSGKETVLGPVTIEVDARYRFDFNRTDQPLPEGAIIEHLPRLEGEKA